jgi:hypothetical protein
MGHFTSLMTRNSSCTSWNKTELFLHDVSVLDKNRQSPSSNHCGLLTTTLQWYLTQRIQGNMMSSNGMKECVTCPRHMHFRSKCEKLQLSIHSSTTIYSIIWLLKGFSAQATETQPTLWRSTVCHIITKHRILMRMHISFLQPKRMLIWLYVWITSFLNFRHDLMVHINAYFACFMNKRNICEDLYVSCIFSF